MPKRFIHLTHFLFISFQNDNRTFYLIISNIVMCSIVMTELLVYCYFGNEITYQVSKLHSSTMPGDHFCFSNTYK